MEKLDKEEIIYLFRGFWGNWEKIWLGNGIYLRAWWGDRCGWGMLEVGRLVQVQLMNGFC